jgi:cyclomaltodextrinase
LNLLEKTINTRPKQKQYIMKTTLSIIIVSLLFLSKMRAQEISVKHPEWAKNAVIYEANIRQFSEEGTINEFAKYLPELKKMGVGIVWLMPITPIGELNRKGELGSYYSVKDYKAINPEFGTEADFRKLVNEAHELGMYVILDWVANHSAWDNEWTKTNPEFYTKGEDGNFIPPVADWNDVIDFNYDNQELREAMIDALLFWVKEYNIDGYRCDVAAMVPTDFWVEARKQLDAVKPVFMLAEAHEAYLQDEAFDMTYSWAFKDILREIKEGKKTANDLHHYLVSEEYAHFHPDAYRMVHITNHDENSWNGTAYERLGDGVEMFSAFTSVVHGMKLIYSGQEGGLNKRLSFFGKDTIQMQENHELRNVYATLNHLKKRNQALWNGASGGKVNRLTTNNDEIFYSFIREKNNDKVLTFFNFSPTEAELSMENSCINGTYRNVFTNEIITFTDKANIKLDAWDYLILEAEETTLD